MSEWKQPQVEPGQCVLVYDGYNAKAYPLFVSAVHERFISGVRYSDGGSRFYQQCYHRTSPDMKQAQFQNGHLMWEHTKQTRRMEQIEMTLARHSELMQKFYGLQPRTDPTEEDRLTVRAELRKTTELLSQGVIPSVEIADPAPREVEVDETQVKTEILVKDLIKDFVSTHGAEGDLFAQKNEIAKATGAHHSTVHRLMREFKNALAG